jgi:chromatin segregation and condensation protein Rec8/ScpA/Scc1 (kleisin family)
VGFDIRDLLAFLAARVDQRKTVPLDISTMAKALSETEEEEKGMRQELIACLERKREMKSESKGGEESEAYDVDFENRAANHQKVSQDLPAESSNPKCFMNL